MKNNTFAERITKLRLEHGLKRDELAEKLHCSVASIGNYENGHREPDFDTLVTIANLFNTTTDYLLGVTDTVTTDIDIKKICEKTGLSESAVETLIYICQENNNNSSDWKKKNVSILNALLESDFWIPFFSASLNYITTLRDIYDELKEFYDLATTKQIPDGDVETFCDEIEKFSRTIHKRVKTSNCYLYEIQQAINRLVSEVYAYEIQEELQDLYVKLALFQRELLIKNNVMTEEEWSEDTYPILFLL